MRQKGINGRKSFAFTMKIKNWTFDFHGKQVRKKGDWQSIRKLGVFFFQKTRHVQIEATLATRPVGGENPQVVVKVVHKLTGYSGPVLIVGRIDAATQVDRLVEGSAVKL